jgi:2',3'-cyclic-nucleotide 2'-phosphodiesterase (5'-nucleotidase family)
MNIDKRTPGISIRWRVPKKQSYYLVSLLACLAAACFAMACGSTPAKKDPGAARREPLNGRLTIVFMNDTHTHLYPWKNPENGWEYGGAARWATIIKNIRSEAGDVLFLHAGDMFVGSDDNYLAGKIPNWERLPGYGYRGLLEIPVFKKLGLDAACFGNHEFDYGLYWNRHLFKDASFDLLAANLTMRPVPATTVFEPTHFKPYAVYDIGGVKVGVIGMATDEFIKTNQIKLGDPAAAALPLVEQLKSECDVTVVLSHLGVDRDQELAAAVPGIDVIVGGHTHTYLEQPLVVNGTIITQTRCYGQFVGRLDLEYQGGNLVSSEYKLIPADFSVPEDPEIRAWLDERRITLNLSSALAASPVSSPTAPSLGSYAAQIIAGQFSADAVLIKSGLFKGGLPAGPVSAKDFFNALWPYRMRDIGPEKELAPQQIMDIMQGKAPAATRHLLENASGLTTLLSGNISAADLSEIENFVVSRVGSADYFSLYKSAAMPSSPLLVLDMPSWIDLYREGILDDSFQPRILEREIVEVLLGEID